VTRIRPQQLSLMIDIPECNLGISRRRQKEMAAVGKKPDLRNRLGMKLVGMEDLLGNVIFDFVPVAREFDTKICALISIFYYAKARNNSIPVGTCIYVLPW
jgi:cytochrome c oxidase assembly protein Cox11